ncbi:hypothetical protein GTV32_20885 [Gordonia sp. SID5947]|uniref:hypothetical protein n=1 Tax=Gordonia sp. SID5947 TaxID=2690315 RepID=UPI001370BCF3|nr:hypothetical protein [Gordonia sp. SID5947]MYR08608.1 hypothetical protein [Gordonia sp. SID5947]
MAPQNPRPPRKKSGRKPYTPRVAGSGQRPGGPRPESESQAAESTPSPERVDSNLERVDGNLESADSNVESADGNVESADGNVESADGNVESADGNVESVDGNVESVDGNVEPADGNVEPAEKAKPAGKTRPVARVSTLRTGDAAASSANRAGTAGTPAEPAVASTSGMFPFSRRAIGILIGVAVVLGIFALIAGLHPGASISSNKAFIDQPATTELTSQVQSKACSLTVDTLDVDKWADEARAVLTGNARSEFDKYLPQQREILKQTKQVADCRVESVGVADLSGGGDGATARVVANLIVSQKQAGISGQSAAPRYQFSMVKHGDDWLISQVEAF